MDPAKILGVAAGLAGLVSTVLAVERSIIDRQLDTRAYRLRGRAEGSAQFLQILTEIAPGTVDEELRQQAISSTKTNLDSVLRELIRIQQVRLPIKVEDMSPIRRWLLLFVPARRFAWVLHFGFYFVVWMTGLYVADFKAASQLLPVTFLVPGVCLLIILAAVLRYWALMEMKWAQGFRPSPSSMYRFTLWYSPASRRELIARAALLVTLFQFSSFILVSWKSRLTETVAFIELSVTLIVFYAWTISELRLENDPVEMRFPSNLRFLHWPQNQVAWFSWICFYGIAGVLIFDVKQAATANVVPAVFRNDRFLLIGAVIGLIIDFSLKNLLPLYALNRILMAHAAKTAAAPLGTGLGLQ
jgi:hypothetical protein